MSNKTNSETNSQMPEEFKDQNLKHNFSKFEYDLYHDEDNVILPIIRVKYINLLNGVERWKIFKDSVVVWVIEGNKLTNKEKEFLRSLNGANFLIAQYKEGICSFNHLKTEIKKRIKITRP